MDYTGNNWANSFTVTVTGQNAKQGSKQVQEISFDESCNGCFFPFHSVESTSRRSNRSSIPRIDVSFSRKNLEMINESYIESTHFLSVDQSPFHGLSSKWYKHAKCIASPIMLTCDQSVEQLMIEAAVVFLHSYWSSNEQNSNPLFSSSYSISNDVFRSDQIV